MSERKARRESPAVNAGSMADIAFLLLIFFLVTTTIAEDQGVLVRLPPWVDDIVITEASNENVLTVIVNTNDEILVKEARATVADLPTLLRRHVISPDRKPNQAIISFVHDRGTSYTRYVEVYDALLRGYHDLWDEAARRDYGTDYAELTDARKRAVRKTIPMIISEAEPTVF